LNQVPHDSASPQSKRRILFLCQTLPYPPDGGVNIRAFHLLRLLAQEYEVTAMCFFRRAARPDPKDVRQSVEGLSRYARTEAFEIPQEFSHGRLLWDHLRSILTQRPYTVFAHRSEAFIRRLREFLANQKFDLVHMDSLDLSGYLPDLRGIPVVVDHHNVESALLRRRSRSESNRFRAFYINHQSRLTQREERRWCREVDLNLTVSGEDRDTLQSIVGGGRFEVTPNGVDTNAFAPDYAGDDGIVFVGGLTWFPNRDGMEYFGEEILPIIRSHRPDVPVRWVGRASDTEVRRYRDDYGIEMTGYVDDIQPFVRRAACFIVPLRVGGGTRLKILDAWAMGKAVVSTSQGCEGLDARDEDNILIRDTPEDFAASVLQLLEAADLRRRLGEMGRKTVEQTYDWDVVGSAMIRTFEELLEKPQGQPQHPGSL